MKTKRNSKRRPVVVALFLALTSAGLTGYASTASAATNGALLLNGSGQYASLGVALPLDQSTFTIETRFRQDGAGATTSTGADGISNAIPLVTKGRWEQDGSNVDANWFLGMSAGNGVLVADFEEGATGPVPGRNHPVYGSTPVTAGVWHSAAATYDGTTWRLYLDGKLDATLAVGEPARSDSIQWAAIGSALNSQGTPEGFFNGAIDESRVWNYARSDTQVAAGATTPIVTAPGLVGRWAFDEGSGTTAADSSGSGVNATLMGGAGWTTAPSTSGGAPDAPAGLTATPGDSLVDLSWTPSLSTSVVGYQVYRSTTVPVPTTGRPANPTLLTQPSFRDVNVVDGTNFSYVVVAVDSSGLTSPPSATAAATPVASGDPVFVGAGDIASCTSPGDQQTATLLDGIAGTVFTLGDNAYTDGTAAQFSSCYDPTWGRAKIRTHPLPGNHDYYTGGASGYYGYFGASAGDPTKGWYSYDLGTWHIVVLNSECSQIGGCGVGSAEETWLRDDLAAHPNNNILAMWHEPRFDSYMGMQTQTTAFWNDLYAAHADVILGGHSHLYERWAPQTPSGTVDNTNGIREITVGTGGAELFSYSGPWLANSLVHATGVFGVLKLTLGATSYSWQFVPAGGSTFTDSGTAATHRTGSSTPPTGPAAPTGLTATASTAGIGLSWSSTEPSTTGFNVARATSASGPFTALTPTLVSTHSYFDATAPVGVTSYYQVTAVDSSAVTSSPATASVKRSFAVGGRSTATVSGGRTLSLAVPSGAVTGDTLLATVTARGKPSLQIPSGWSVVRHDVNNSTLSQWVIIRGSGSALPTSTTWTFGSSTTAVVSMLDIQGVSASSPVLTTAAHKASASSTIVGPSVSPSVAGALIVGAFGTASGSTFLPPLIAIEEIDAAATTGTQPTSEEVIDRVAAGTGSTGTWSVTPSAPGTSVAQTIALRPM